MNKLLCLLALLTASFFGFIYGQNGAGSITGKVYDQNNDPLPFANVLVYSNADSSLAKAGFSNDAGVFLLTPLSKGSYSLKVTFTGLSSFEFGPIEMAEGQTVNVPEIYLKEVETEIDEVQIRAEKPLITVKPDMTVFNVAESPNAIGSNAFDLLRKAPGVVIDNNDNLMLLGKNGVRIFINGKPSQLSAADLAAMLKSMQSNQIEAIEIITNPSAKYDAEGNAGIINIKMIKDERFGTNGSVNAGYAIGIFSKYSGGASLNYRNKIMNAFGSYSLGMGKRRNFMQFYTTQNNLSFDQDYENIDEYQDHNFRGGMDFYVGKKHTFGFLANGFRSKKDGFSDSRMALGILPNDSVYSILSSETNNNDKRLNLNFNLNYMFDAGNGRTLNIDADYGQFTIRGSSYQPNFYFNATEDSVIAENIFSSLMPTDIQIWTSKADYEQKLWGGTFGAGLKFSWVTTDNTFDFYNVIGGEEIRDPDRSNNFVYRENINAGYITYEHPFKEKWNFKAGLRVEHTNSLGLLTATNPTNDDEVKRNYVSFFPSAGITFKADRDNSLRLNYGRRVDRPRYTDLNPFEYRLNELSYWRGNPFLQPQFTHNIQFTHTYKYTLTTTLSYSNTTDFFTNITDTTEVIRSFLTKDNLSTQHTANLSVSYPRAITKWWSTFTTGGLTYLNNIADFGPGKTINLEAWTFNLYHQSTFQLPWKLSFQLSGFYSSPGVWGANFRTGHFGGIDAGLTKKFLKDKLVFQLSVTDIFFTQQWVGEMDYAGRFSTGGGGWESRQFKANLIWSFGNQKVKTRKRKTGLEDEKGRAKGGD